MNLAMATTTSQEAHAVYTGILDKAKAREWGYETEPNKQYISFQR